MAKRTLNGQRAVSVPVNLLDDLLGYYSPSEKAALIEEYRGSPLAKVVQQHLAKRQPLAVSDAVAAAARDWLAQGKL